MSLDPVALIQSPPGRMALLRCQNCGTRQTYADPLPTGGVSCAGCGAPIGAHDRIEYASPQARLGALVVDACCFILPIVAVAVGSLPFKPLIATDINGRTTHNAVIATSVITIAVWVLYVWALEAIGDSLGKHIVGMRVVRATTWRRPGIAVGFLRLLAKLLTISTLGAGYALMLFDPERRTLHDRIAGTRVVQR